jgi:hypothetical protein
MRGLTAMLCLLCISPTVAQTRGDVSYRQASGCNAIVEQNRANPYAYLFREHCEQTVARVNQGTARILGRPQPSLKVLDVPAHGTGDARRLGVACIGGLVMLRIENGWKQALDSEHRYYTCRNRAPAG